MIIQCQISIYPLRTDSLTEPIFEFCETLKAGGLKAETSSMSTFITEESDLLFCSLQRAYEKLSRKYDIVMDFKVSNTCPEK